MEQYVVNVDTVVEIIRSQDLIRDFSTFDPAATFTDNGIDSLDQMTIHLAIEEHFHIKFTEDELGQAQSATQIVVLLNIRNL